MYTRSSSLFSKQRINHRLQTQIFNFCTAFIPPDPTHRFFPFQGPHLASAEDVVVDDRGNIIIDALEDGFYILRKTYED